MSEYIPERWIIVDYGDSCANDERYAVLAGWYGGFVGSNCWKRSSPIVKWEEGEWVLRCTTKSGSVYVLYEGAIGVTMLTASLMVQASLTVVDVWDSVLEIAKGGSYV